MTISKCSSTRFVHYSSLALLLWVFSFQSLSQELESKDVLLNKLALLEADSKERIPVLVDLVQACWRICASEAKTHGQQALSLLDLYPNLEHEAELLVYLPRVYQRDGMQEQTQALIDRGMIAVRKLGDKGKLGLIMLNQAILYSDQGKLILASDIYEQLDKINEELNNLSGMASSFNNRGRISRRQHDYGKALEQYQAALKLYTEMGSTHYAANALGNIGEIYTITGDFSMAEESILRGKQLVKVEEYPRIYLAVNLRLTDVYIKTEEFAKATELLQESLSISQRMQIRLGEQQFYAKLIDIALLQNDSEKAQEYYQQARVLFSQPFETPLTASAAKLKIQQSQYAEAEQLVSYIVAEIEKGDTSDEALEILNLLIEAKEHQGDWQSISDLLELYLRNYKEQVKKNQESRLEQFSTLYKANEKERQIADLEQQNNLRTIEVLTAEAANRQIIFIAILVAAGLFIVLYLGMQKRKMLGLKTQLLEAEAEKKTRLFSDISHELRTPLSVLKLQIEGLEHDLVDDPKSTYQLLHTKLASINRLISDISQLAQADAGDLSLTLETVNANSYFHQWCKYAKPLAAEKGLTFSFDIQLGEVQQCSLDPQRIEQVLNNLLTNSCRYTDSPGQIAFSARVKKTHLVWQIEDSAPGLSDQQLSQVFERLYRADSSRSRKSGGSGLGLSICKSLVEAHNGQILAEKGALGGLSITVSLPLTKEEKNHD